MELVIWSWLYVVDYMELVVELVLWTWFVKVNIFFLFFTNVFFKLCWFYVLSCVLHPDKVLFRWN